MTKDHHTNIGPVVSSAHLAQSDLPELSEVEYALTLSNHAFQRWIVRCMDAAGEPGMAPLEVLILHQVNHRDREKTLADIRLVLHIEDTHLITYAVRKLSERGLVSTARKVKEKTVGITDEGRALCGRYRDVREALLVDLAKELGFQPEDMSRLAALLRALSGSYDQAARAATTV
ncbi:MAG: winged helix DNA-binding protein [Salibaculum sp.]|jgi:predicted MarR family transcription regulator|uniref:winged helix DNA-binding protein n=1 Tax=Roseovarius halophilus (ex Wu et al. 2025) TaxID=3376060 RepID=UPI002870AD8A|nr:winged helix DNA-binding protein [Salibaculum sp.]MDR9427101.1 winged helix DNA-binding protein [Salibaculum sp.]MDR9483354.1 winged helix DNA-binding protein [Salibaculum sp.]